MRILVTGATGYVGSRLVPRLLEDGHEVRATRSRRSRAPEPWWSDQVELVGMDVLKADQVLDACAGMDAVYYLIHGMDSSRFAAKDRAGARNMVEAVRSTGVERVVYLSGIIPPVPLRDLSEHLSSRLEIEHILADCAATVLTLRAAMILGSGSTSFEILRQVSERMPLQTVPSWMHSRVQPIAVVDVIEALAGALTTPGSSRHYDIGGPDRLPYPVLLEDYARIAGLTRPQITLPLLPTDLVGTIVGALTDVPCDVVRALVESLHHDMVAANDRFREDLLPRGYELMALDEAISRALAEPSDAAILDPAGADPMGPMPQDPIWADGGDTRPLLAKAIDTALTVLPGGIF